MSPRLAAAFVIPAIVFVVVTASGDARNSVSSGLIAFSAVSGKQADIYAIGSDGTNRRQLTRTTTDELCPSWSPDGAKIAFTIVRGGQPVGVGAISAAGQPLWQIPGKVSCSGWSPDGKQLLLLDKSGSFDLADADGQNLRPLNLANVGSWPAWSPDGKRLAFVSAYSDNSPPGAALTIIVAGLDGQSRQSIRVKPPTWCAGPSCRLYQEFFAWAPGKDIAFVLVQGDLYPERLYAFGSTGRRQRLLSGKLDDIYWPAWSPDGRRIAFVFRDNSNDQIWTANANGSGVRQVTRIRSTTSNLSGCFEPAWSPDSTKLLCAGHARGMYVADAATGRTQLLVRDILGAGDVIAYSWQPVP